MQTGECPKRQTVSFRTAVGLHGFHTTHDQNAFAVKACETFKERGVKGLAQPGSEKNSCFFACGTFPKKTIHSETPDFIGLRLSDVSILCTRSRLKRVLCRDFTGYFRDRVTFFANSLLPNLRDISICNKSDLIIAFYSSAQAFLMLASN